jgi:NAD(P)-dependent dehydrogenase (short-subunit alcohol dehydrogenase family)
MIDDFLGPVWAEHHGDVADFNHSALAWVAHLFGGRSPVTPKGRLKMSGMLQGQTVVVLGGSSGIGEAVALLAYSEGARVFALSRSGIAPEGATGIAAAVEDTAAVTAVMAGAGVIHHLVHTVGARVGSAPLAQMDDATLPVAFEAKLFSAIKATKAALPYLAPEASITLTSGQVSRRYGTGSVVKGAVNAATDAAGRHLAKELAPRRVNVISPGVVDTALWGEPGSEARVATMARVSAALPVQRPGTTGELARGYLFLMTNGFVTGAVLDIDGGGLL